MAKPLIRTEIIETVLPYFQKMKISQEEFIYHLDGYMARFEEFCKNDEV